MNKVRTKPKARFNRDRRGVLLCPCPPPPSAVKAIAAEYGSKVQPKTKAASARGAHSPEAKPVRREGEERPKVTTNVITTALSSA